MGRNKKEKKEEPKKKKDILPSKEPQEDEDVAFPRGGADALTPLERKQVEEEARLAVEQEEKAEATTGKRSRADTNSKKAKNEDDADLVETFSGAGKSSRLVLLLNNKRLNVGTRLLAMVLEVTAQGLTLSLPHGMRGHVAPEEASDILAHLNDPESKSGASLRAALGESPIPTLPDIFSVGQFVCCQVLSKGGADGQEGAGNKQQKAAGNKVKCTLRLKKLCAGRGTDMVAAGEALPGVVRSVEDHGFTLDLGIKGVKAFLPRADHEAAHGEGATLQTGSLVNVYVVNAPGKTGVAKVTTDPNKVASALTSDSASLNLATLLPGQLVKAKVSAVLKDGLQVKMFDIMSGSVDVLHLGPGLPSTKAFKQDDKVKARVLYVDPVSKEVGLSLLPHIMNLTLPSPIPMLGQIFDSAPVSRVDEGLGLLLQLPLGGEMGGTCPGYCHITNTSDDYQKGDKLVGKFRPGVNMMVRVVGFRLIDGLAAVSAKTVDIEKQITGFKDIQPGMFLNGKVIDTEKDAGLLVEVAPHVTAVVPVIHMSDLGKESARQKFKVGQQVKGRVLNVDQTSKKLSMTLKPALLNSKTTPITTVVGLPVGFKSHGVITGVRDNGVFVTFYNGVSALASLSELALSKPGDKPSSIYSVGQVVRARVVSVNEAAGKLKVSLKSGKGSESEVAAAAAAPADPCGGLQPGSLVMGTVSRVADTPGGKQSLILSVWREGEAQPVDGAGGTQARLDLPGHLADHPAATAALLPLVSVPGTVIGPLVVLERMDTQKSVLVSRKYTLVAAAKAGRLPTTFDQVREGLVVPGYVTGVSNDAVYVRLAGHVTGRAGLSQIADTFVTDPTTLFKEGQSVRCQVVTVDAEKKRFSLTLKPSLTASTDASYAASLFRDLELAAKLKAQQQPAEGQELSDSDWTALAPGQTTKATVHELADYGLVMDIDKFDDLVGVIRQHQHALDASKQKPGTSIQCKVLDVSKLDGIIDLTAKADLVGKSSAADASGSAKKGKKKGGEADAKSAAPAAKLGESVEAVVQLIKDAPISTAVVSIPSHGNAIAHVALTDFNAAVPEAVRRQISIGSTIKVTIQALPSAENGGRLLVATDLTKIDKVKTDDKSGKESKLTAGALVTATVLHVHDDHLEVRVGKKTTARISIAEIRDLPAAAEIITAQEQQESKTVSAETQPKKKAKKSAQESGNAGVPAEVAALLNGFKLAQEFKEGQEASAAVLPRVKTGPSGHHGSWELSLRPSLVKAAGDNQPQPAQPALNTIGHGSTVVGVVSEVTDDHVWVSISAHVRGRLNVLDISPQPSILSDVATHFPIGRAVAARVAHVDAHKHTVDLTLLPTKLASAGNRTVVSSSVLAHASSIKDAKQQVASLKKLLHQNTLVMGKVIASGAQSSTVRIALGGKLQGRVALTDVHDVWVPNALTGLTSGTYVRAAVLSADVQEGSAAKITLSLRPSHGGCIAGFDVDKIRRQTDAGSASVVGKPSPELLLSGKNKALPGVGAAICGYVKSADAKKGVFVTLDRQHDALIKLSNLSDGFVEDPVASFPVGMIVEGRVVNVQGQGDAARVDMSLRSSDTVRAKKQVGDFQVGQVVTGKVRRVEKFGVFVDLENSAVSGLAHISAVSDGKVKDINALFRANQIVKAKIIKIDEDKGKVSLSMKPSDLDQGSDDDVDMGAANGHANGHIDGPPSKKQKKAPQDLDEEMADEEEEEQAVQNGDIDIDSDAEVANKKHQGKGLKQGKGAAANVGIDDMDVSDEENDDDEGGEGDDGDDSEDASELASGDGEDDEENVSDSVDEGEGADGDDSDDEVEMGDEDEDEDEDESEDDEDDDNQAGAVEAGALLRQQLAGSQAATTGTATAAAAADGWGGLLIVEDENAKGVAGALPSEGSEKKASKAVKKREREEAERKIREAELARLKGEQAPQSVADFERSVLASPNSSYTWIRYMAWLLGLGETDKARAVAQRALDTIQYREEGEKFNVWVAWLNLEAAYGAPSPTDALMTLFNKAVQYCDAKKLYFALLGILTRHSHAELEEATLKAMCKRFGGSAKVWLKAIETNLVKGDGDTARKTLERALQALPQRKHIKVITGAALLEFRQGSAERGRGIMEGVLRNYPKRLDLWSVYVDQEIKLGDEQRTRALFERATTLSLAAKKMKFLFKRWLEWEKSLTSNDDNSAAVEHVKQRAMEFVQNSLKA